MFNKMIRIQFLIFNSGIEENKLISRTTEQPAIANINTKLVIIV